MSGAAAGALYRGWVRHRRLAPRAHSFRMGLFYPLLDVERVDEALAPLWGWSARRPAPARFVREHYLGDPARPLAEAVRDRVEEQGLPRPAGPVRLLGQLQYLGHCFNPVVFYFCHDAEDRRVEAVVAEITNTPWGERRCYVFPTAGQPEGGPWLFEFDKDFHVSPFMPLEIRWRWRFTAPGRSLVVHMENWQAGERIFDATLSLRRSPLAPARSLAALLRWPALTVLVVARIHWEALRLWLKRLPVHAHPDKRKGT